MHADLNLAIDLDNSLTDAWLLRARQKAFFTGAPELGLELAFDADNALADFNRAVELARDRADIILARAEHLESPMREYSRAEADYSKAIELAGPTAESLFGRGRVRLAQNEHESAIEDFSRAIRIAPDGIRGEAFCYRAEARRSIGLTNEAASDFQMAIDARRDWLWKSGDDAGAESSDEMVYGAAFIGLKSIRQQTGATT